MPHPGRVQTMVISLIIVVRVVTRWMPIASVLCQVESPDTNSGITSSGGSWAQLEYQLSVKPSGLVRQDDKRPDGLTLRRESRWSGMSVQLAVACGRRAASGMNGGRKGT